MIISFHFVNSRPNEDTKYTGGVITFDLLEGRPGQGKDGAFDAELRQFMLASAVKIRLEGHPSLPNNNEKRHTYHGITELKVQAMYVGRELMHVLINFNSSCKTKL